MHVICALAMYVVWWRKPMDVGNPITVDLPAEMVKWLYLQYPSYIRHENANDTPDNNHFRHIMIPANFFGYFKFWKDSKRSARSNNPGPNEESESNTNGQNAVSESCAQATTDTISEGTTGEYFSIDNCERVRLLDVSRVWSFLIPRVGLRLEFFLKRFFFPWLYTLEAIRWFGTYTFLRWLSGFCGDCLVLGSLSYQLVGSFWVPSVCLYLSCSSV